jgi:DDE superfamily endonuclease
MTGRRPCPAAPGPLEGYAARFDDLFTRVAQRRGFREYLAGLLAPRDRNKTLTALAGAEPVAGAQHPAVQRLQFFLSESRWDADQVNSRRLELLLADPATAPHGGGVLVIDDSGDRKDGRKTAHVGHQWLGRYGKTDNGVVTVTTVWADERVYYPVHAVPYTPARHFAKGKNDPAFRTKLAIGADLAVRARDAGFAFRAVAADSAYGDQDGFRAELSEAGLPFVMALKPRRGTWAYGDDAHTPVDAARALAWGGPEDPGDWTAVTRTFRDGHAETWWAADARLGWWGPDEARRLAVVTADPGTLPGKATWYLVTNLPRPGGPGEADSPYPAAGLAEITRIYGIRHWIEMVFTQLAKRAVRPLGGGREHVADLHLVVGDDHAVDEQLGEQPPLLEGSGGEPGPDGLAEALDPAGGGLEFEPLAGGGIELPLLGGQGGMPAVQVLAFALELGQLDDLGEVGVQQALLLAV